MGLEIALAGWIGSTFAVSAAAAAAAASTIIQLGASVLLSAAAGLLAGQRQQPTAQAIKRELAQPSTEPAYRFNLGETRAQGTPVGTPVKGGEIWGAWLLDSRAADLSDGFRLFLDERAVDWAGNPFDLDDLDGGYATTSPFSRGKQHLRFWITRGAEGESGPPRRFLEQAARTEGRDDLWQASDAWRGRTVIWMMLVAGDNDDRQTRWPNTPPLVSVEGKWARIWDPRDAAQDPDDPDTWVWSDNHALVTLDVLRNNPVRPYRLDNLLLQSFIDGAEACDALVQTKAGSERRYRAAGTQTFDRGELEDLIKPLLVSGAAALARVGGRLAYVPGIWHAPTVDLGYLLGEGFSAPDMLPGDELVNELRVSYLSPARGYETASLEPWPIPGALAQDGGVPAPRDIELSFCPSPTQAMRVRKITGLRMRRQERLEGGTLPPEAFDLVAGANATVSLPGPYGVLNGIYEIESLHPALDPVGRDGVALRMPAVLVKTAPEIYDWDPDLEEEEIIAEDYDATRAGISVPGAISITTGDGVNRYTGDTVIPRIRFAFAPSPSGSVDQYEYQSREVGGAYGTSGFIGGDARDGNGDVFGHIEGVAGQAYDIRVRAISPYGRSDWLQHDGATAVGPTISLVPPSLTGAPAVTGDTISVDFETPNDADVRALEIWGADAATADPVADAELLISIALGANRTGGVTETGLSLGQTRHYYARTRGPFDSASPFAAGVSATTA